MELFLSLFFDDYGFLSVGMQVFCFMCLLFSGLFSCSTQIMKRQDYYPHLFPALHFSCLYV